LIHHRLSARRETAKHSLEASAIAEYGRRRIVPSLSVSSAKRLWLQPELLPHLDGKADPPCFVQHQLVSPAGISCVARRTSNAPPATGYSHSIVPGGFEVMS
jgi:hypothetical protein